MIISIYVPRAIWDTEEELQQTSRFRMQNIYEVEDFYHQLKGEYSSDPLWALNVVNAIRDSLTADTTFLEDQVLNLAGKSINVNIPAGWSTVFDTTFGFRKVRKDTISYMQYEVVTYIEARNAYDTLFVQYNEMLAMKENPTFVNVASENEVQRVEAVTYYTSYMPDSSYFYCPLTQQPYAVTLEKGIKIASPIADAVTERRYLIFSFRAENHGYIEDGVPSWQM
ncbi:MAG: hypothetical protein ABIA75_05325 [Candidatus Neomarinimicrobiota bacterium]